jgi:hypothetical protein
MKKKKERNYKAGERMSTQTRKGFFFKKWGLCTTPGE